MLLISDYSMQYKLPIHLSCIIKLSLTKQFSEKANARKEYDPKYNNTNVTQKQFIFVNILLIHQTCSQWELASVLPAITQKIMQTAILDKD